VPPRTDLSKVTAPQAFFLGELRRATPRSPALQPPGQRADARARQRFAHLQRGHRCRRAHAEALRRLAAGADRRKHPAPPHCLPLACRRRWQTRAGEFDVLTMSQDVAEIFRRLPPGAAVAQFFYPAYAHMVRRRGGLVCGATAPSR
jgi:hypothetical protein